MSCFLLAIALQAGPDRSGEAEFRKLLNTLGKLKSAHVSICRSVRDSTGGAFVFDRQTVLWYNGPTVFNIQSGGYWGDAQRLVADSKTSMQDPCDDNVPIILRSVGTDIISSSPDFDPKAGWGLYFFTLLKGPDAFDQIIGNDSFIKSKGGRLEMKTRGVGLLTVWINDGLPTRLEYDNRPAMGAAHQFNPLFNGPVDDPMIREDLEIRTSAKMDKSLFSTTPPKGRKVEDRRKKSTTGLVATGWFVLVDRPIRRNQGCKRFSIQRNDELLDGFRAGQH